MRVLIIGDVFGRPGRNAVAKLLPEIKISHKVDFTIANGENSAGGKGITSSTSAELLASGIDVITTGNHVWAQRQAISLLESEAPVIRPLNYPPNTPGRGFIIRNGVAVVNLLGRIFMQSTDCPFRSIDNVLENIKSKTKIIIVDFHAEATSEKIALSYHLDGKVSAVVGTHTHVPTADARILPKGTSAISDIGMVGPSDSVIGVKKEEMIKHFLTQLPHRFEVAEGPVIFNSVLIDIEEDTGMSRSIERIDRTIS